MIRKSILDMIQDPKNDLSFGEKEWAYLQKFDQRTQKDIERDANRGTRSGLTGVQNIKLKRDYLRKTTITDVLRRRCTVLLRAAPTP
jgi:hypothetical protein